MRELQNGQLIRIAGFQPKGEAVGSWICRALPRTSGVSTRNVVLQAEFCDACDGWHTPDQPNEDWPIPFDRIVYRRVTKVIDMPHL